MRHWALGFALLAVGCGGGMKTLIRLRPLMDTEAVLHASQPSVTKEKDGVKVTVTFLDRVRLEGVTESVATNPFISEWRTLCTVFQVDIENKREGKVRVEPQKLVILDGLGNQLNGLTVADFERWYPTTSTNSLTYSYVFNEYTPTVVYTPDFHKRKAAQEKLLKGGDLYPGVKQSGLVAFDPIKPEAGKITLILPLSAEEKDREGLSPVEISFQFAQEISPKLQ